MTYAKSQRSTDLGVNFLKMKIIVAELITLLLPHCIFIIQCFTFYLLYAKSKNISEAVDINAIGFCNVK
jgi:hypothetical protein